jgi:hypothetical protein
MEDLENKSNNDLLFEIKQMEADYEALKIKMLQDLDKMDEMDRRFDRIQSILIKRLNK